MPLGQRSQQLCVWHLKFNLSPANHMLPPALLCTAPYHRSRATHSKTWCQEWFWVSWAVLGSPTPQIKLNFPELGDVRCSVCCGGPWQRHTLEGSEALRDGMKEIKGCQKQWPRKPGKRTEAKKAEARSRDDASFPFRTTAQNQDVSTALSSGPLEAFDGHH